MHRSKPLALALALLTGAGAAFADPPAQPPADAPIAAPEPVQGLQKGQPAPADGVWLSLEKGQDIFSRCKAAELERDKLRVQVQEDSAAPGGSVAIGLLVVGAVVGLLVGGGLIAIVKK